MTNVEHSTALARIQGWVGLGSFYEVMEHVQPNILLMLQRILIEVNLQSIQLIQGMAQ